MKNKTILITGGTDGIGKQAAKELAQMGATVVIVGRNVEKTERAVAEIKAFSQSDTVDFIIGDLSLISEVRKVAMLFKEKYDRLDVLFNNAGAVFRTRQITAEGLEETWALNHLAYFLLTHELLDLLDTGGRIVNTSSAANYRGTILFDDLGRTQKYGPMKAYSQSKLANIMFTYALARRLKNKGITVNCLHPGLVNTNIGQTDNGWLGNFLVSVFFSRGISIEKGTDTAVYLCSSDEVAAVTGEYFAKRKVMTPNEEALDEARQERLWTISEKMAGIA